MNHVTIEFGLHFSVGGQPDASFTFLGTFLARLYAIAKKCPVGVAVSRDASPSETVSDSRL